jgi:hypothetical protein
MVCTTCYSADGGDAEVNVLVEAYIYFRLMGICQKIEIYFPFQ